MGLRLSWVVVWVSLGVSTASAQDACPDDPDKVLPGYCGCGVADSDWSGDGSADSCIDPAASVHATAVIGERARVDAGASIGPGAQVGASAHVGVGATVGADATVAARAVVGTGARLQARSVLGRRGVVGANVEVGIDTVLGRAVQIGAGARLGDRVSVGYASVVGLNAVLGDDVVVGNLVTLGNDVHLADRVVLARSVVLGGGTQVGEGTIIGPECVVGADSVLGAGVRLRKHCTFGIDAQIGDSARIGRDAHFGDSARIGADAVLRASVTGGIFVTVDADAVIPRGTNLGDGVAAPLITEIVVPADAVVEPGHSDTLSVSVHDPQDLSVTSSWSFVGEASGWSLSDPGSASTEITAPGPTGPSTVTVRIVVDNGALQSSETRQITLFSQPSCWIYNDSARNRGDGLYWVSPTGDVSASQRVFCDQSTADGGWMLVSERRGGVAFGNQESCGTSLDTFFASGCGTPGALGSGTSYAMSTADRQQHARTAWMFRQFDGLVADDDDAWVGYTSADLFAPSATIDDRPLDRVCSLTGVCDTHDVWFRYVGDHWFANSTCHSDLGTGPYHGNYGLCHAGVSPLGLVAGYESNTLFGNRAGYDETKLWGHGGGDAARYTERVFLRDAPVPELDNQPPTIVALDAPSQLVRGTAAAPITVTVSDPEGDSLVWDWTVLNLASGWVVSGTSTPNPTVRAPQNAAGSDRLVLQGQVSDGNGNVDNRIIEVSASWAPSCKAYRDAGLTASGIYTIDPQQDDNRLDVYCEMSLGGGGWTLVSNRREDAANVENCGAGIGNLASFFTDGCGSVTAISGADSYALAGPDRNRVAKTQMMMAHYDGGVLDADDGIIMTLDSLIDPFPNVTGTVRTTTVPSICALDGTHCDTSGTFWIYTGDNWFASSTCQASFDSGVTYRGNYGYCVSGRSDAASNALGGTGNRAGYDETKLWGYGSSVGGSYQERVFYR